MNKILEETIREQIGYCPVTGDLFWKVGRPGVKRGSLAGGKSGVYKKVMVQRRGLLAHRVAFFLTEGRWPSEVDHINRNPLDNSWENLREVTRSENQRNKNPFLCKSWAKSGIKGVYQIRSGRYRVLGRGSVNLGLFDSIEEAGAVATEHWQGVTV